MALFPNTAVRPEDADILRMMEDFSVKSMGECQGYWYEAATDARFEAGDQSVFAERYDAPLNRRNLFSFNRIRRNQMLLSGHQRQNRKSFIVEPLEDGDEDTASQMTKILMYLKEKEGISVTISDAFEGSTISGFSLLKVWIDYTRDPVNGDPRVDYCPYNSVIIDPFFKKADLSDCNFIWNRSYLTPERCAALYPKYEKEILALTPDTMGSDGKFPFMPETRNIINRRLLSYDEFYYRSQRKQRILIDTQTGEVTDWNSNEEEALNAFLERFPTVIIDEKMVPTVNLAVVIQGNVFYNDINPIGIDEFPFVPVFCYFRPDLSTMADRLQGMVRGQRDAQYLYNRRKNIELDMIESQTTTGIMYKEGTLVDPKQAYMTGQGRALVIKKGAELTDVQQIMPPQIPPSFFEVSKGLEMDMQQITGINEAALGIGENTISGYDTQLKQNAALVTMQPIFDALDRSQKLLGKMLVKIIQNSWTPGKVKRVIAEEPTREFYTKNWSEYDCVVVDGYDTSTQRAVAFAQALHLREVGINVPDKFIIENSTIQNKKEMIAAMEEQQQQAQQMQQQQEQVAMQELQSRADLAQARILEQESLAHERSTRSVLNVASVAEKQAQSNASDESAKLSYVRTLEILENLPYNQLERLLKMSKLLDEPFKQSGNVTQPIVEQQPLQQQEPVQY